MSEFLATALNARVYENADPATSAEAVLNRDIRALDRLLVQAAAVLQPGDVLPLRFGAKG